MWKATVHRKVENLLGQHSDTAPAAWRAIPHRTEDTLTSTVFERLSYLPGDLATRILFAAARLRNLDRLPQPLPISRSEPWPNIAERGPKVEPDWLLHTARYTLMVEAKWGRGVVPALIQLTGQQLAAADTQLDLIIHVIVVQSGRVVVPAGVPSLVVRWGKLRQVIQGVLAGVEDPGVLRTLQDIVLALDQRGLNRVFLGSLRGAEVHGHVPRWSSQATQRPLPGMPLLPIHPSAGFPRWT